MKGSVTKRCSCPPAYNARGDRVACKTRHGSWQFVADAGHNPATGKRRQIKRGGFATKREAEDALAELVDASAKGMVTDDGRQTVAQFLATWIADKERNGLRATTLKSYRQHIEQFLVPHLGRLRLKDLRPGHVEAMLAEIARPRAGRRTLGPSSVRRVHATLRSALAVAKRRRLVPYNAAVDVELPVAHRPKVHPWEAAELGQFLDHLGAGLFAAIFEVIAATGLRRGEALGLRWSDVDLERRLVVVRQQVVQIDDGTPCAVCGDVHRGAVFGRPKTKSGEDRVVELDEIATGVLLEHRLRQDAERAAVGGAYNDHGLVFAREDGTPVTPERVTKRFGELCRELGLRPIRLHDLRHGRASLLLAAGIDIAVVSKLLGHSTITLTADTYSHLLEGVGRDAADRASRLVPRATRDAAWSAARDAARDVSEGLRDQSVTPGLVVTGGEAL